MEIEEEKELFQTWFARKVLKNQLKAYHYDEIYTFIIKDNKKSEIENPNLYDEILKKY